MKSILREELKKQVLENEVAPPEVKESFIAVIDKLPLDLVRQFLSRFLELNTTASAVRLDMLAVISQQTE